MYAGGVVRLRASVRGALWGEERWEASAHPAGLSVIASGPLAGRPLAEAMPGFPLIAKTIDARARLSVQVHPSGRTVPLVGGEPKTEMWCMLSDGFVYAGLKPGVAPSDVAAAVKDGGLESLLVRHDLRRGDAMLIPGGLVHSIGESTCVYEVQQSSDTTFRLYDWGRVDADGRPRELHVEKALAAIDFSLAAPKMVRDVSSPYFRFSQALVEGELPLAAADVPQVLHFAEGDALVNGEPFAEGECALVSPGVVARLEAARALVFVSAPTRAV